MYPFRQVGIERDSHPFRRKAVSFVTGGAIVVAAMLAKGAADAPDDSFASIPSTTVFEDESIQQESYDPSDTLSTGLIEQPVTRDCADAATITIEDTDPIRLGAHTEWRIDSEFALNALVEETKQDLGVVNYTSEQFFSAALEIVKEDIQQDVEIIFNHNGELLPLTSEITDHIGDIELSHDRITDEYSIARGLLHFSINLDRYHPQHFANTGVHTVDISSLGPDRENGSFSSAEDLIALNTHIAIHQAPYRQYELIDHELAHATHDVHCQSIHYYYGDKEFSDHNSVPYAGNPSNDEAEHLAKIQAMDPALFVPGPKQEFANEYGASSVFEDYATIVTDLKNGPGLLQPGHPSYGSPYHDKQLIALERESVYPGAREAILHYARGMSYNRDNASRREVREHVITEKELIDTLTAVNGSTDNLWFNGYIYTSDVTVKKDLLIRWPYHLQIDDDPFHIYELDFEAHNEASTSFWIHGIAFAKSMKDETSITIPVWTRVGEDPLITTDTMQASASTLDSPASHVFDPATQQALDEGYELVDLKITELSPIPANG